MNKSPFPAVPRLESLHHRLKNAKDADREPFPLLDELMVFLEDPPPGVGDRWQAGAELCTEHGVATSRMAVWRLYRAHILSWRREQLPSLAAGPEETAQLLEQARHLIALRALECLPDPRLSPRVLVGLAQNENRRRELQLARDKFKDQLQTRDRHEYRKEIQRIEGEARFRAMFPFPLSAVPASVKTSAPSAAAEKKSVLKNFTRPASPLPVHNT